jgi:hypothetical protein
VIFKLDATWDCRNDTIVWSFLAQDERAESLLKRLGFRDQTLLILQGVAAVAAGKMLKACGAKFQ